MLLAGLKTFLSFSETKEKSFSAERNDMNSAHSQWRVRCSTFGGVFMPP